MAKPKVIILGGGVAAIAMAHTLKWKLGLSNFTVSHAFSSLIRGTTPKLETDMSTP